MLTDDSLMNGCREYGRQKIKRRFLVAAAEKTPEEPKPVEILSEHKTGPNAKKQYLVRFTDKRNYLCDWVNKALIDHYKAKRTKER